MHKCNATCTRLTPARVQNQISDRTASLQGAHEAHNTLTLEKPSGVKFKTLFDLLILSATSIDPTPPPCSLLTKVINKADRVSREVFNPYKYDRAFVFVGSEAGAEEENKGGRREL